MATSSLLGIDRAPTTPRGRDATDLGPSDSSDSGSDVAGLGDPDEGDPGLPADTAAGPDRQNSDTVADAFSPGADSDRAGTGERRSAADDAGRREASDIGPDRIVSRPDGSGDDAEDPLDELLAEGGVDEEGEPATDALSLATTGADDPDEGIVDDEDEDEEEAEAGVDEDYEDDAVSEDELPVPRR